MIIGSKVSFAEWSNREVFQYDILMFIWLVRWLVQLAGVIRIRMKIQIVIFRWRHWFPATETNYSVHEKR